jgi:hypothetical protein
MTENLIISILGQLTPFPLNSKVNWPLPTKPQIRNKTQFRYCTLVVFLGVCNMRYRELRCPSSLLRLGCFDFTHVSWIHFHFISSIIMGYLRTKRYMISVVTCKL